MVGVEAVYNWMVRCSNGGACGEPTLHRCRLKPVVPASRPSDVVDATGVVDDEVCGHDREAGRDLPRVQVVDVVDAGE